MSDLIKFKKGLKVNLPNLGVGEPGFTTDEKALYIGGLDGNVAVAMKADVDAQMADIVQDKVDKVTGKGLSTNDYDNIEKAEVAKVSSIETKANNPLAQITDNTIPSSKLKQSTDGDKIGLANLKTEVISAMNGTSPTGTTVIDGGVTTPKIANGAVTSTKLDNAYSFIDTLTSAHDLNTPLKTGIYMVRADVSAPLNMPAGETGEPFVFEQINVDANTIIQKTYNFTNPSKQWYRRLYGGTPTEWTTTYVPDTYKGNLISTDDLNNVINTGSYIVDSSINSPFGTDGAVMSVAKSGNYIFQDITSLVTGERRYRAFDNTNKTASGLTWRWIKNIFNSNIVAFLGDSITAGAGGTDDYVSKIPKRLSINTINYGVSGTTIAYENLPEWDAISFQERAKTIDLTGVKYLVIFGGTNDFNGGRPIGTDDSVVKTEFKGGLNLTIQTLLGRKSDLQILLITPMWRNVGGNNSDTVPNSQGLYLRQYVTAVQDIAKKYKFPCLNLYDNCGINTINETQWLRDGIHPTLDKGYDMLADKISAFLQGHI